MYLALWLTVVLVLLHFYRKYVFEPWLASSGTEWHTCKLLLLSPHSWLYASCFTFLCGDYCRTVTIMYHSDWLKNGLDTEVHPGMDLKDAKLEWHLPLWLRCVSLCVPFICFVVAMVTLVHMCSYMGNKLYRTSMHHHYSVDIVLLPFLYSVMGYKGVIRMWNGFTGEFEETGWLDIYEGNAGLHNATFEIQAESQLQLYGANFEVADLYEAWALWHFAQMCLDYLDNTSHMARYDRKMRHALHRMAMIGVIFFVIVSACKSIVGLAEPLYGVLEYQEQREGTVSHKFGTRTEPVDIVPNLNGAAVAVSIAASYNLIVVEHSFEELLPEFDPGPKFWSAKLILTLTYVQKSLFWFINWLLGDFAQTKPQNKIFFASVLCIELLFVAVWHIGAWNPDARWYGSMAKEAGRGGGVGVYGSGGKTVVAANDGGEAS